MSSQGRRLTGNHKEGRLVGDRAAIVLGNGDVCIIDLDTGNILERKNLGHAVVGKAKVMQGSAYGCVSIFVPHVGGHLSEISYKVTFADEGNILSPDLKRPLARGAITTVDLSENCDVQMNGYSANTTDIVSIVDAGDDILVGFARDTYANEIPLIALDKATLKPKWRKRNTYKSYGNLRAEPLIFGEDLVIAPAYSDGLSFVSAQSGHLNHDLCLGSEFFEQWSSPVTNGKSVYVGRVDGFFHKVDVARNKIDWTIYLGHHDRSGAVYRGEEHLTEVSDSASWNSGSSSPIFSTPTVTDDRSILGTFEGYLYCIANI